MGLVYIAKSQYPGKTGDENTVWLSKTELPLYSVKGLEKRYGAEFIRKMEFNMRKADEVYGASWLDWE